MRGGGGGGVGNEICDGFGSVWSAVVGFWFWSLLGSSSANQFNAVSQPMQCNQRSLSTAIATAQDQESSCSVSGIWESVWLKEDVLVTSLGLEGATTDWSTACMRGQFDATSGFLTVHCYRMAQHNLRISQCSLHEYGSHHADAVF